MTVYCEFKQSRASTQSAQSISLEFSWKAGLTHINAQCHKCRTVMQGTAILLMASLQDPPSDQY